MCRPENKCKSQNSHNNNIYLHLTQTSTHQPNMITIYRSTYHNNQHQVSIALYVPPTNISPNSIPTFSKGTSKTNTSDENSNNKLQNSRNIFTESDNRHQIKSNQLNYLDQFKDTTNKYFSITHVIGKLNNLMKMETGRSKSWLMETSHTFPTNLIAEKRTFQIQSVSAKLRRKSMKTKKVVDERKVVGGRR